VTLIADERSEFDALTRHLVLASGLKHERRSTWTTDAGASTLVDGGTALTAIATSIEDSPDHIARVLARSAGGGLVLATWRFNEVSCRIFAASPAEASGLLHELRRQLPRIDATARGKVAVHFWGLDEFGGNRRVTRWIAAPTWSEIRGNYRSTTRADLDALMALRPDISSGKLVLWHGPAGTGKTWALRALVRQWDGWAQAHYILDPAAFFTQTANHMLSVILGHEREENQPADATDGESTAGTTWRLIVVEDVGELLGKDARLQTGQGLARLLNLCDGLIGQGRPVLVLLTSNEEIGSLHPAVTRRGRCIANIAFDRLSADESSAWLRDHAMEPQAAIGNASLLADLFAAEQVATSTRDAGRGFLAPAGG
jgi:hypothetical protein